MGVKAGGHMKMDLPHSPGGPRDTWVGLSYRQEFSGGGCPWALSGPCPFGLQELGVSFGECSAALGHNILEPMVNLAR